MYFIEKGDSDMYKLRKMVAMSLMFCFTCTVMLSQNLEALAKAPRVVQKKYTIIAKNVRDVQVCGDYLYLSQKKNKVIQIDLTAKLRKKEVKSNIYYRNHLISKEAKAYFPDCIPRIFIRNKQNEIIFEGGNYWKCYSMFRHKDVEDCERDSIQGANKVVLKNITRCWYDSHMFAYVQNNNLVVTGMAVRSRDGECYESDTRHTFFKGQADQVKQVVSGNYNVFVLMKDGSVWGRGRNENKLISDSSEKYYKKFVEIVPCGVKAIAATGENVGMLKKDGTLWLWGEKTENKKVTRSTAPYQIADDVKEFSLGTSYYSTKTGNAIVVLLKKNNVAYGWGMNKGYALTSKYKKGWIDKPVKLKSNIKHVYTGDGTTFLLDKHNRLYWAGDQRYSGLMDWIKA